MYKATNQTNRTKYWNYGTSSNVQNHYSQAKSYFRCSDYQRTACKISPLFHQQSVNIMLSQCSMHVQFMHLNPKSAKLVDPLITENGIGNSQLPCSHIPWPMADPFLGASTAQFLRLSQDTEGPLRFLHAAEVTVRATEVVPKAGHQRSRQGFTGPVVRRGRACGNTWGCP